MVYYTELTFHRHRDYLTQWFNEDIFVITDVDINFIQNNSIRYEEIISRAGSKRIVVDLSHNAMPMNELPKELEGYTTLVTMWDQWYQPSQPNFHYFPFWFWMFSNKIVMLWDVSSFDAPGNKTKPMMCLNRNRHPYRLQFRTMIAPVLDKICFTMGGEQVLEDDKIIESHSGLVPIDIGVGRAVYSECAVNIVTETMLDRPSVSEKTCKPFIARQIPIIVGPPGINQFLASVGLDMFSDLVPWQTWDNDVNDDSRLQKIANFVQAWINAGTVLHDYNREKHRVERNKQYFHSNEFRNTVLKHMSNL